MQARQQRETAFSGTAAWSSGKKAGAAALLALLAALLLNLGMPGLGKYSGWWPLLCLCLSPLLLIALSVPLRPAQAAAAGFLFGLAAYTGQLYWIVIVLGRYGGLPLWLSVPALLLLAAYMALYSALFCLLLSWLRQGIDEQASSGYPGFIYIWAPPLIWTGLDALRGALFTGFPWMDLGYGLFREPQLLLPADLGGHHLLSFCLVLINAVFTLFLSAARLRKPLWKTALPSLAAACSLLIGLSVYSLLRSVETKEEIAGAPKALIGLVQGNIEQDLKWSEEMKQATVERYLRHSAGLAAAGAALVVWPETALPFYPQDDPLAGRVAAFAGAGTGTRLLTGAPFYRVEDTEKGKVIHNFNGALILGPQDKAGGGAVHGVYSKQHLVPFGEYIPLKNLLFFLKPLAESIGGFSAGQAKGPLFSDRLRVGVLICYESIFPVIARDTTALEANMLVNITNDAWYGRSSAPVQSLAMAVLRAVENRRALVRSANTGISGFVDPLGRISGETAIFTEAAAAEQIPLLQSKTVFTRIGHYFGLLCALLILPLALAGLLRSPGGNAGKPVQAAPAPSPAKRSAKKAGGS